MLPQLVPVTRLCTQVRIKGLEAAGGDGGTHTQDAARQRGSHPDFTKQMTSSATLPFPFPAFGLPARLLQAVLREFCNETPSCRAAVRSVLLCGPRSAGKSALVRRMAPVGVALLWCGSAWSCGPASVDFASSLTYLRAECATSPRAIIVFDALDLILAAPSEDVGLSGDDCAALAAFCAFVSNPPVNTLIIGIATGAGGLHPVRDDCDLTVFVRLH